MSGVAVLPPVQNAASFDVGSARAHGNLQMFTLILNLNVFFQKFEYNEFGNLLVFIVLRLFNYECDYNFKNIFIIGR